MEHRKPPRKTASTRPADAPWERANPKAGSEPAHLTPQAKAAAKRRAKAAGRPYPNLVDNMRASAARKR